MHIYMYVYITILYIYIYTHTICILAQWGNTTLIPVSVKNVPSATAAIASNQLELHELEQWTPKIMRIA